jgi:hypothetical protein
MPKRGTQRVAEGWGDFMEALTEVGLKPVEQRTYAPPFSKEQVLEAAFEWFRMNGFPYRKLSLHECMQEINFLATMDSDSLLGTNLAYGVADTYHPHRFHAHATDKISPVQAFLDDRRLRRAMKIELGLPVTEKDEAEAAAEAEEKDGEAAAPPTGKIGHTLFSPLLTVLGTQACANFRPGYAAHLYRRFCPQDGTVLDTSTGYGGRLVGAIASRVVKRYVGIDPNVPTHIANQKLAHDLAAPLGIRVELLNQPAEDVWIEVRDSPHVWWWGQCDMAFTSPPYFAKERYSTDPTQSWVRYGDDKTGEGWRTCFLVPMMQLQYAALKPGAHAVVNIADVKIKNQSYPLKQWTIDAGKEVGFVYLNTESFKMNQRVGANQMEGVAEEPVLIFRKPER